MKKIHKNDNVAVLLTSKDGIPAGHKVALTAIAAGAPVIKYGYPIGVATGDIHPGDHVHTHNLKTALTGDFSADYTPDFQHPTPLTAPTFLGYRRASGKVGIRNELWIIPAVGCIGALSKKVERDNAFLAEEFGLDGVHAFDHPYGCSQLGDDDENTRRLLAALCCHPNAGGVLVLSLGCENNTPEKFKKAIENTPGYDETRVKFLTCQEEPDDEAAAAALLRELAEAASKDTRTLYPASDLILGMKCGGSDGLSGITANPLLGRLSDTITAMGGSAVLTEVPEMFGAEDVLLRRCVSEEVFQKATEMLRDFRTFYVNHNQPVYENPSPGNKAGGITTLEEKSLGCVQKGGTAPVCDVIGYGETVKIPGLTLLSGPGNDLVSSTALAAAGCQMVLFTTGRGTPFATAIPTVKVATNTNIFNKKRHWFDFDAQANEDILPLVLSVASGQSTAGERGGLPQIAIFKTGVTL